MNATEELKKLDGYVERAAVRASVRTYLFGLPLGAAVLLLLGGIAAVLKFDAKTEIRQFALSAMIAGGIGSMASVMIRITRGQKLSVDIHQGPTVTLVAGFFRPLIGAVFGLALYILFQGGLLPLEVPVDHPAHFYAGLGFLAGFSERWAQDTIVRSAPISPSPAAAREANSTDDHDSARSGS